MQTNDVDVAPLIQRIEHGDTSALMELYDKTTRLLFGLAVRILCDRQAAEEVLLEIYTQVWRRATAYDSQRNPPLDWLLSIARDCAIDRLRADMPESGKEQAYPWQAHELSEKDTTEGVSVAPERQRLVRSSVAFLAPEQRQVIELAYYRGLSQSEIAYTLRQPLSVIKSRGRLAMIGLSQLLQRAGNKEEREVPQGGRRVEL